MYLSRNPNVDLVFPPTFVNYKLKFLVPECKVGFEEKWLGLFRIGFWNLRSGYYVKQFLPALCKVASKEGVYFGALIESSVPYLAPT